MAKLPPEFVKVPAPAAAAAAPDAVPAPDRKRKPRRATLMTAERARDLAREVMLRLGETEHRELELAREELRRTGEDVTLEQIVLRVIADWCARRTAERAAPARGQVKGIIAQLRRLAGAPRPTWRELGAALRRLAPALLPWSPVEGAPVE